MRLIAPRLEIRRWILDDVPAAFAMCSDPEVMRYVGDGRPVPDLETMRGFVTRRISRYESDRLGSWAITLR